MSDLLMPEGPAIVGGVRLGRVAPPAPPLCPRLSRYMASSVALPEKSDWAVKAKNALGRMYLNDRFGCCVIASAYHQVGVWTGNDTPTDVAVADAEVLASYNKLKAGPGDSGCVITQVLDYWRTKGLPVNGAAHRIDGYVAVNHADVNMVKAAIVLFGGLTLGLNLPSAWQDAAVWDTTGSQLIGGHDVLVVGYDATGVYVSTWGSVRRVTWPAFTSSRWIEEAYAILSADWYNADNLAPNGLDVLALKADLDMLTHSTVPDVTPPPAPLPPPPGPSPVGSWTIQLQGVGDISSVVIPGYRVTRLQP